MTSAISHIFPNLPDELRERLEQHYHKIKQSYIQGRYESSELNGGKFCEIVFRILEWHINEGNYTALGTSVRNLPQKLINLGNNANTSFNDSVRFHIPQISSALYPIRNKRGVAHHAGGIDPNYMDATFVVSCADWIMAELVRLFHNVSLDEAQKIVESLVTKQIPVIWQIGDHKRVISPLDRKLSAREKVLLLLYNEHPTIVTSADLLIWIEYDPKNRSRFRSSILGGLHKEDLIHFDAKTDEVHLSLVGIRYVEKNLPLSF